jgi:thiamine monophosphate synthase
MRMPVIAIGGITPERAVRLREAGAYGVAVLSGIWGARDPRGAVKAYSRELSRRTDSDAGSRTPDGESGE